jgi:hypothetical protein
MTFHRDLPTRSGSRPGPRRLLHVTAATACLAAVSVTALGLPVATAATGAPSASGAATSALTTSAAPQAASAAWRGRVVDVVPLGAIAAADVARQLRDAGFDATRVAHGVDRYRVVYRTVGVDGRPTVASGLVVLPRNGSRALDVVSYAHGSEVYRGDAPSVSDDEWTVAAPLSYASAGYAAVAPDYLGLGTGPGPHPWLDVPSEVTAQLDLLRAARAVAHPRVLRPGVLLTGFSQGASAATGLAKALQGGADGWFRAAAVAPISGAYDLRRAELPALLRGDLDPFWSTAYTAYLLVAWNRIHHLYDSPGEVFAPRYAPTIEALFDGEHTGEEVGAGLPPSVGELLTPAGRRLLEHPDAALARTLRIADATVSGWRRPVPVRLYRATGGDEQVAAANTDSARRQLAASGVPVTVVDVGRVDHLTSNARGTAAALTWFTKLRPPS